MTPVRLIAPTLAARTQSRQHIDRSKQISHCVSFFFSGRRASPAVGAHTAAKTCGSRSRRLSCGEEPSCGRVRGRRSSGRCSSKHSTWRLTMRCAQATSPLTSVARGAVPVPERTDMSSSRPSSQPFIASAETPAIDFAVLLDPIPTSWHLAQLATVRIERDGLRRCTKRARSVMSRICSRAWPFK